VKVGISLRGHFPISQAGLDLFMAYAAQLPPGSMYDVPAGDFDTRTQARNLIEVARAARESGLDMLLIGDHHAMPVTNFFQPTPTLGRLLAETGDMPVGILYLAPFLHPVLLAEQVGTLAAFAPEPLTLVLSIGAREGAFRAGVDPAELYIHIAALGFFYFSNIHTLSVIFERDLDAPRTRRRHIKQAAEVILGYLRP